MEFEEIKKIWDTQNQEPMYAINETELHRSIRAKLRQSNYLVNVNEIGLIMIALITSCTLSIIGHHDWYNYLSIAAFLFIAGYIFIQRNRRIKQMQHFDRSMLGDLEHAIANVNFEIRRNETFLWWFLLPVVITSTLDAMHKGPSLGWVLLPFSFVLSYVVVQWSIRKQNLPKKRELEQLRDTLLKNDAFV